MVAVYSPHDTRPVAVDARATSTTESTHEGGTWYVVSVGPIACNLVEELAAREDACAWSGCRRGAVTRGFYGGRLSRLCQLHRAMSDRALRASERRR